MGQFRRTQETRNNPQKEQGKAYCFHVLCPWSHDDGFEHTSPVGHYPDGASPFGVLDMAGTVWEWVWDFYDAGYYTNSPAENPTGPEQGEYHVLRGGSWNEPANEVRGANRHYLNNPSYNDVGFRCASSP